MREWDYNDFTIAAYRLTGVDLAAYNERQMKRRIDSFLMRNQCRNYCEYYMMISSDPEQRKRFTDFLTINVTEFFRNPLQWETLGAEILPALLKLPGSMKIWSSACSTGEEPYSVALLMNESLHSCAFPFRVMPVLATDIDDQAIAKAKQGDYLPDSLKNLPEGYCEKYFDFQNGRFHMKDRLKSFVRFQKLNLLKDLYPRECHLILCRNVMIYFTQAAKDRMYRQFYDALLPGGVLFLGSTEQILNPERYGLTLLRPFFYRKGIGETACPAEQLENSQR